MIFQLDYYCKTINEGRKSSVKLVPSNSNNWICYIVFVQHGRWNKYIYTNIHIFAVINIRNKCHIAASNGWKMADVILTTKNLATIIKRQLWFPTNENCMHSSMKQAMVWYVMASHSLEIQYKLFIRINVC